MGFHKTQSAIPGKLINAGDVIQLFEGPFCDAVILGFNDIHEALVSRPYVYAHNVGTGPVPLTGVETLTLTVANLTHMIEKWGIKQTGKCTQ